MIVITVARKPPEGTISSNVLKYGCGGLNIEESRVRTEDNLNGGAYAKNPTPRAAKDVWTQTRKGDTNCMKRGGAGDFEQPSGRWPSNVILSHLPECKQTGTKKVRGGNDPRRSDGSKSGHNFHGFQDQNKHDHRKCGHTGFSGTDGKELVAAWNCIEGCPIAELDRQSGTSFSSGGRAYQNTNQMYSGGWAVVEGLKFDPGFGDEGGASRFFKQVKS